MKKYVIVLWIVFCFFSNSLTAQDSFESRVRALAVKIENIKKEEKASLQTELDKVDADLANGDISKEQAEEKKLKLSKESDDKTKVRINQVQEELAELIQQKAEGKLKEDKPSDSIIVRLGNKAILKFEKDTVKYKRIEPVQNRTTSQFVFALGFNNLMINGSPNNSDFKYWGSHFYEFGFTLNTRLSAQKNLLHLKYGLSLVKNDLRPTDNRVFVADGMQTTLETYPVELDDSRFRNVYVTVPVHLEFDFSKKKCDYSDSVFKIQRGFCFGIGGYTGFRTKSKQKICYHYNDQKIEEKAKGDFNVSDFVYGLSTYLGYKATTIYLKYDINSLFKNSEADQNNISLGLRFDVNFDSKCDKKQSSIMNFSL